MAIHHAQAMAVWWHTLDGEEGHLFLLLLRGIVKSEYTIVRANMTTSQERPDNARTQFPIVIPPQTLSASICNKFLTVTHLWSILPLKITKEVQCRTIPNTCHNNEPRPRIQCMSSIQYGIGHDITTPPFRPSVEEYLRHIVNDHGFGEK